MSKYFEISGYWKDTLENFEGYVVKEFDDAEETEALDDLRFGRRRNKTSYFRSIGNRFRVCNH